MIQPTPKLKRFYQALKGGLRFASLANLRQRCVLMVNFTPGRENLLPQEVRKWFLICTEEQKNNQYQFRLIFLLIYPVRQGSD